MKTKLFKLSALMIAVIMFAGVIACSAAQNNTSKISIGSVGKVKFTLADYMQFYNTYSAYASYMPDLNGTIKEQLINYGTVLTKCYDEKIELDDADEQELKEYVETEFKKAVEAMTVDESIEGEEAIYAAKLEAFKKQMKENGYNEKAYKKELEENRRKTVLMDKLREKINAEVEFGKDQVKSYFDEHLSIDEEKYKDDAEAFANAYSAYISGSGFIPLYTPEDMFTVKQLLIQYENKADVSEEVEGVFNEELNKKIEEVRDALEGGISLEKFMSDFVTNGDYNDDYVFTPAEPNEDGTEVEESEQVLGYREHGYIVNENTTSMYYDGFGAAACMLKYGEDWVEPTPAPTAEPEATAAPEGTEATAEPTAEPEETTEPETTEEPVNLIEKYAMKFYETTDGHKIAEVKTPVANGGIHFIFIHEELESGAATLDLNDEESPVYANIAKNYKAQLEEEHYNASLEEWKKNTKVKLNETYIDNFAKTYLGIN